VELGGRTDPFPETAVKDRPATVLCLDGQEALAPKKRGTQAVVSIARYLCCSIAPLCHGRTICDQSFAMAHAGQEIQGPGDEIRVTVPGKSPPSTWLTLLTVVSQEDLTVPLPLHPSADLTRQIAPELALHDPQSKIQSSGDAGGGEHVAVIHDACVNRGNTLLAHLRDRLVMSGCRSISKNAGRRQQHAPRANRGQRGAVFVKPRKRRREPAALGLSPGTSRRAIVPAASRDDHQVSTVAQHALWPHSQSVASNDFFCRIEGHEANAEVGAERRGIREHLIRADCVELVDAVEDDDRYLDGSS